MIYYDNRELVTESISKSVDSEKRVGERDSE